MPWRLAASNLLDSRLLMLRCFAIVFVVASFCPRAMAQQEGSVAAQPEAVETDEAQAEATENAEGLERSQTPSEGGESLGPPPSATPTIPQGYEGSVVSPYSSGNFGQPNYGAVRTRQPAAEVRRRAPRSARPANLITFNPLALALGALSLDYERSFGDYISIFIGPEVLVFDDVLADLVKVDTIEQYGAGVGARFFFFGTAPMGFYLSPGIILSYTNVDDTVEGIGFSARVLSGFTWIWDFFTLSLGGGIIVSVVNATDGVTEETVTTVSPAGRTAIGIAF